MSQKFQSGELVNVRLDGVRYIGCDEGQGHGIETPDGSQWSMPWSAVIERVAPKEWPPQPGDIWEDHNRVEWLAVASHTGTLKLVASHSYDDQLWPQHALEQSGWRLVRRRGWTPDTPPTEPTPAEVDGRAKLIAALRTAADWIEQHTDLPVSGWRDHDGSMSYCTRSVDELERLADQLGTEVTTDDGGHMHAIVEVDGLRYRAFHVPAAVLSKRAAAEKASES